MFAQCLEISHGFRICNFLKKCFLTGLTGYELTSGLIPTHAGGEGEEGSTVVRVTFSAQAV
jgi:hypothetical protein